MKESLIERQSAIPRSIPLLRYIPERVPFSWQTWDPGTVNSVEQIPQYLILGKLDPSSFIKSTHGWFARWQGYEDDTYFDVTYKPEVERWEISQTWCGVDGGFGSYSTETPLEKIIGEVLYARFPRNWDAAAKGLIEANYQAISFEQSDDALSICGIPDGAFKTIMFQIAVPNLRPFCTWLQSKILNSQIIYPVTVEARCVSQAINYLEGRAPEWTTKPAEVFYRSVTETGLVPHGATVRETAADGTVAWTLRRESYFLLIGLPFAGLMDFLQRIATEDGPVRTASGPTLRFELQPLILHGVFQTLPQSIAFFDQARTTRSSLQLLAKASDHMAPTVAEFIANQKNSEFMLSSAEAISADLIAEIVRFFNSQS